MAHTYIYTHTLSLTHTHIYDKQDYKIIRNRKL